jgi:hypothetical protein
MTTKTRTVRRPQPIEESKMQGYFMISKRDAAIAITNKLTGSQCRLWLYLMLIDPFADRTAGGEIKYHDLPPIPEIAIALGSSSDTVEKDLRKLRKLGLYEYRTVTIQGHNCTAANARLEAERLKTKNKTETKSESKTKLKTSPKPNQDKDSAYLSPDGDYLSPDGDYLSSNEDYLSPDEDYLSPDGDYLSGNQEPETVPDKQHSVPSDRSNLSKLIKTLSEDERESFLNFVNQKVAELPKPPTLPNKWIEANFEELRDLWEKQNNASGSIHCEAASSTKVLDFENWEDSRHQGQYFSLTNKGLAKFCENPTSKAWYEWAVVKYPHKFVDIPS